MARQIVILDSVKANDGQVVVSGFYWFPITNLQSQIPKPQYVSAGFQLTGAAAVTPEEQAVLESGATREETFKVSYPVSATRAQIRDDLITRWTDRKAAIDAEPPTRRWYGQSWNGVSWTT